MYPGILRVARGGSGAKAPLLAVHPLGSGLGQFPRSYEINGVCTTHLGRELTLYVRLSQLRLTNLFFVLFLDQPRLHHAERQGVSKKVGDFQAIVLAFGIG